jgi:serine/threonine-protein kinase
VKLPPELWPEVSALLDQALALAPSERPAWLDGLAGSHPHCAPHLRRLVAALQAGSGDLLQGPAASLLGAALAAQASTLTAGILLGPYRLVRRIGKGGMASVWLADQTASVLRRVALKIPHGGLDTSPSATLRFTRERDLLATLEHPHIARLYDAGVAADGTPYLAMEWIDGLPLTRWCDEQRLGLRARLQAFQQVLAAVQYAHAKLVIHRDLKPANILVTADGQVKLLDFGIAQLLHGAAADAEAWALTPDTASPEQLAGAALGTPSDVYALGVVLYELLAGARPYRLRGTPRELAAELARQAVRAPSQCALTEAVAAQRGASPRALRRALAGDLDAIVARAMHLQAARRYPGAADFAADIERHLGRWPVQARAATPGYRLRCHVQRNRGAVLASALVAGALCAGTAIALWQADRARDEARRAQAVQAFLVRLFEANDPQQAQGRAQTARELLDKGAREVATGFADQPRLRAELQRQLGAIYISMGDNAAARPLLEEALNHYAALGEAATEAAIDTLFLLLEVQIEEGLYESARSTAGRVLELGRALASAGHRWALPARRLQAWALLESGRANEANDLLQHALAEARQRGADAHLPVLMARSTLGSAEMALGRYAQARDTYAGVVTDSARVADYPLVNQLPDRYNLARARYALGEFETCVAELAVLVPQMDRTLGAQHDRTLKARGLWAQALAETGRVGQGIAEQRLNLEHARARSRLGDDLVTLQALTLAKLLKTGARYDEGAALAAAGLAGAEAAAGNTTWITERGRWILGDNLLGAGHTERGLVTLRSAVERARALPGHETHTAWADMQQSRALAELRSGNRAAALQAIEIALPIYRASLGAQAAATLRCAAHRAWLLALDGDAATRAAFSQAAQAYAQVSGAGAVVGAELAWMEAELGLRRGDAGALAARTAAERAIAAALGAGAAPRFIGLH